MIVVSLLLILVAVILLGFGLTGGASSLLIGSIVASLLAAVALVISARQNARLLRPGVEPDLLDDLDRAHLDADPPDARPVDRVTGPVDRFAGPIDRLADPVDRLAGPIDLPASSNRVGSPLAPGVAQEPPASAAAADVAESEPESDVESGPVTVEAPAPAPEDLTDEPAAQAVTPDDAVQVARLDAEVFVVDGRPRYHFADCPHLVGRVFEPIVVNEAVELGFTPCGLCRPVERLVSAVVPS